MKRVVLSCSLLVLIGTLFWYGTSSEESETVESLTRVGTSTEMSTPPQLPSLPPIPEGFGVAPAVDAGTGVPDVPITIDVVQREGVLGREKQWVEQLMAMHRWTPTQNGSETTYENWNKVRLTYRYEGGVVVGARAEFPATALSADLTVLSEYFVGNAVHFPFHFESLTVPVDPEKSGRFVDADGQSLYFRGRLRTDGEPPYGPVDFEIGRAPFDDGAYPVLEQDEHTKTHEMTPKGVEVP